MRLGYWEAIYHFHSSLVQYLQLKNKYADDSAANNNHL